MSTSTKMCPICSGEAALTYHNMPGYIADASYTIFACSTCETSFADPLVTSSQVYDGIYEHAAVLPGYERYYRYAELVTKVNKPLSALKNSEVSYWAVINTIQKLALTKSEARILEIGSGLGYLTYALNKEGYHTTGIDISSEAVNQATARYDDYFATKNLFDLVHESGRYDCVVMMDVIEHVENPRAFIEAAAAVLKPGGTLLITTPNKSFAPKNTIWFSDVPPVHLYFLTEAALTHMADQIGLRCDFVDFTNYSKKFTTFQFNSSFADLLAGLPRLNADGSVRGAIAQTGMKAKLLGVRSRYWLSYIRRRLKAKNVSTQSVIMCAVLSKN